MVSEELGQILWQRARNAVEMSAAMKSVSSSKQNGNYKWRKAQSAERSSANGRYRLGEDYPSDSCKCFSLENMITSSLD